LEVVKPLQEVINHFKTTDAHLENRRYLYDFIPFSPMTKENLFPIFAPLYEKGLSLREIEKITGISKTTVRVTLSSNGVVLRKNITSKNPTSNRTKGMRSGTIPYGYTYLDGKLVKDPHEYKNVIKAFRYWQSGKSFRAIARELQCQKLPTRTGKKWSHELIKKMIGFL
jgi:DNA invertase Pin-like site-specific DNA recombinase